jgi:LysM repeat protein
MKINPFVYGLIVVIVFFGTIVGFQQAGVWSTSGKVDGGGQQIQPSAADVNTIKGWMTLEQVSTTFGVPVADILSAFDLPADTPASTALKDVESETFSVSTLRTWLQERQPVP